ncbi:serine hydrolase [Chelatococcus sp. SYSU_G07232]|uniref:Serine hydrolase n=1 Tax=Chelatococcus albus TaxID=3047466 RepID=A0ABT7ACW3_9HYPH|nr:serine hydrolase [Chelatococcus sp. SYSU_G07232]MDJ1157218.1 serine hydrolase [Chelatococcus sp. SYSU_G07232]
MVWGCVAARRWHGSLAGIVGVVATVVVATSSPAEAARRRHRAPAYSPPYAAMVVDAKTGRTLHAENEDAPRIPASLTKVMTLYLLFEQLERGRMQLDTNLKVSAYAASQAPSKLGLRPGSTIEVEDAIKALVTKSANDVAVAVAENIAGSESEFAQMMTAKARALGMSRTTFHNANGLPSSPPNITTARDLTILGRAIQDRFPRYYSYFSTRVFHYAGRAMPNHNKLLGRVEGVDGIKTGYTRASGFNLITSAKSEGRHVVAVVLGGRSGASRDQIMASLVREQLPRAYAGARTAPVVAEAPSQDRPKPAVVAEAPRSRPSDEAPVETTAAIPRVTPAKAEVAQAAPTAPIAKPLDLSNIRPVVASASGSTATPSNLRWVQGPQPTQRAETAPREVVASIAPVPVRATVESAVDARTDGKNARAGRTVVAKADAKAEPEAKSIARPSGWIIQLGATEDEGKAKDILAEAKAKSRGVLAKAEPFTEKVTKGNATLYRARFSGFEADSAQAACKALKRSGFSCFATRG